MKASEGDVVELELNESALVFMTFWTYLFPILFMFAVIMVAMWFHSDSNFLAIAGVIGFAGGMYTSKQIIRSRLDAKQLHPVVSKVLKS